MIHYKKSDIAIQRHEGRISCAIVIHDVSILVDKGAKIENAGNQLIIHICDEGRLDLFILIVGDEARHELPMYAWGQRWARKG
jgi:hypothetical protein